jgi:hypothetical protein
MCMTSEAKIAANRRNAQRSTGPRTALAKARVRRNALQHGLAALVVRDPTEVTEVDRVAGALGGPGAGALDRAQALIVAEAQVTLKRVRRARAQIMGQMPLVPSTQDVDARDAASMSVVDRLLRLERYERRALSRRKRAVRVASDPDPQASMSGDASNHRHGGEPSDPAPVE